MQSRAWRFHDYGGPEVLRLETVERKRSAFAV
jgi:hypothetical protein